MRENAEYNRVDSTSLVSAFIPFIMRPGKKSNGPQVITHYSAATHQGKSQGQSSATWEQNAAAIKFVTYLMLVCFTVDSIFNHSCCF